MVRGVISIPEDPVAASPPSPRRLLPGLEAAASVSGRAAKRILQCGIAMATATVSDIRSGASGTVDPGDRNSRLGDPHPDGNTGREYVKHPGTCMRRADYK